MRPHLLIAMTLLGCTGSVLDADLDGFEVPEDCNDDDPRVYPGALETKGDGIDSDCDGQDTPHAFLGAWDLVGYAADVGGYPIFADVPYTGELVIRPDLTSSLVVEFTAYGLQIPTVLDGWASPLSDEDAFNLELDGIFAPDLQDSPANADLDCEAWEDEVICDGALLVIGYNVVASLVFQAEPTPSETDGR